MHRYGDMTNDELQRKMKELQARGRAAMEAENWSEYEVSMTNWYLAKSYEMLPTANIQIGRTYRLAEEYDRFTVDFLEGIMAWGMRESTMETDAVPIAMLDPDDNV